MNTRTDQLFTFILAMVFTGVAINALSFPPRARFIPMAIALPGLALCLWELIAVFVKAKRKVPGTSGSRESKELLSSTRFWLNVFLMPGILLCMIYLFGFRITIPVFVLGYMKIKSKENWGRSLFIAFLLSVSVHIGFSVVLKVPLFEGELIAYIDRFF